MNTLICGSLGDKLYSRGYGKRHGKCIELSYVEMAYLSEKELIKEKFSDIVRDASESLENFDILYIVYRDLRSRGYVLKVNGKCFTGKKNYSMDFYPLSDMEYFFPEKYLNKEFPFILAIVDFDGEVTYYMVDSVDLKGNYPDLPRRNIHVQMYGKRAFYFGNLKDFEECTYGRNEGEWGHLSVLETRYLWENKVVDEGPNVDRNLYFVYRDLRNRGLIVKSGFKYGTHFRVYESSLKEHSKYLVHVIMDKEELQKISRAVRVSHGVKKSLILAYIDDDNVHYFGFSWIRP